jgi:hypothetical protein
VIIAVAVGKKNIAAGTNFVTVVSLGTDCVLNNMEDVLQGAPHMVMEPSGECAVVAIGSYDPITHKFL